MAMGVQTAIGCLARIIGPIAGTALYDLEPVKVLLSGGRTFHTGVYLWLTTSAVMLVGLVLLAGGWRRLVPYGSYVHRRSRTAILDI